MHVGRVRARQGPVHDHRVRADRRAHRPRASRCILTTGRILSQYNVGAQTRRTENVVWHDEDVLEIHPHDAENRGISDGDLVVADAAAPARRRCAREITERMQPGVVYTTFHLPVTGANVITTENSDWATNCPEYKVTAVQVRRTNTIRLAGRTGKRT